MAKGYRTEELLRRYFLRSGYFTVRGVPFVYDGHDITDIDLWLYGRPSSITRHRVIVDAKNRLTPKTVERVFWARGLQQALGVDQAVVATSDKRKAATTFGREQGVLILDGEFLARLQKPPAQDDLRISEEHLNDLLGSYAPTRESGDWRGRLRAAKRPFARDFGYNAINTWLGEGRYFAEQAILVATHREAALRMLLLLASFIALAVDFVMRELAFVDTAAKIASLTQGFQYGSRGEAGTMQILDFATGLIEHYAPEQRALASRIRDGLRSELGELPVNMLAQHFSKVSVSHELFAIAKELEAAAYNPKFVGPSAVSAPARALLGVLLDFWALDRRAILAGSNGDIVGSSER